MASKSKEELQQSYTKLNQQYNNLLEKNQNDLIKIKQKQKTFNDTIETLKKEKHQIEQKYKNDINKLMLELEKMKNGVMTGQKNEAKEKEKENSRHQKENQELVASLRMELADVRKQMEIMRAMVENGKERIEHLEENSRKLIDENISLTSSFEEGKKQLATMSSQVSRLTKQKQQLLIKLQQLQATQTQKITPKNHNQNTQTQGDFAISYKDHNALIQKFNNQIRQLNKQLEGKDEQYENLKTRLRETNDQLKRFMERDKRNNVLLKKKSEEMEALQGEVQNARKSHKTERKRLPTQDSCSKCKQWQQQNRLLKQMVKSMQTMVRVREMQAQRYKNRQTLNNSKVHQKLEHVTETKKSRGELPPLGKKG